MRTRWTMKINICSLLSIAPAFCMGGEFPTERFDGQAAVQMSVRVIDSNGEVQPLAPVETRIHQDGSVNFQTFDPTQEVEIIGSPLTNPNSPSHTSSLESQADARLRAMEGISAASRRYTEWLRAERESMAAWQARAAASTAEKGISLQSAPSETGFGWQPAYPSPNPAPVQEGFLILTSHTTTQNSAGTHSGQYSRSPVPRTVPGQSVGFSNSDYPPTPPIYVGNPFDPCNPYPEMSSDGYNLMYPPGGQSMNIR